MTKYVDSDFFGEEMRNFAIDLFMGLPKFQN
jgi:hypothetical protein